MILLRLNVKNVEKNQQLKKKVIMLYAQIVKVQFLLKKMLQVMYLLNIVILHLVNIFYYYLKKNHLIHTYFQKIHNIILNLILKKNSKKQKKEYLIMNIQIMIISLKKKEKNIYIKLLNKMKKLLRQNIYIKQNKIINFFLNLFPFY